MNPYAASLGSRAPLSAMADTPARIRRIVMALDAERRERSYAPGKWNARQLVAHLAQTEMVFAVRVRMALTTEGYVSQPFEQSAWVEREGGIGVEAALAAYESVRALNLALLVRLSPADLARTYVHPQRGPVALGDVAPTMAGHELHHLAHLEAIAALK